MQVPVQIVFRDMPVSDSAEAVCWAEAENLERYYGRITSCRVVIAECRRRQGVADQFVVHIDLTLPGAEIVVGREPDEDRADEDAATAIREAFGKARRQLQDHVSQQRARR